jgi:hypothetical protein
MSIMADFLPGRGCAQANFSQFLRRENAQMAAFLRRCLEVGLIRDPAGFAARRTRSSATPSAL